MEEENFPQPNQTALRRPVRPMPQQEEEKKVRIKGWMAACMIIVALCVDGIQFLLTVLAVGVVLGPVISVAAWFGFWVWFILLKVSFVSNPKKLATMGTAGVGELIPIFGALPLFTAGIATTIFLTMAEDRGGVIGKAAGMAQGKIKP